MRINLWEVLNSLKLSLEFETWFFKNNSEEIERDVKTMFYLAFLNLQGWTDLTQNEKLKGESLDLFEFLW